MNPSADMVTLRKLHAQIDDMCRRFRKIRSEAVVLAQNGQMPDAALHLNDVLKATEDATMTILDAATALSAIAQTEGMPPQCAQQITERVGVIYEACSFQDISGQRIRRVLDHLNDIEDNLMRLSELSKGQIPNNRQKDLLMQGPQLSSVAPSQADVDNLFGDAN